LQQEGYVNNSSKQLANPVTVSKFNNTLGQSQEAQDVAGLHSAGSKI